MNVNDEYRNVLFSGKPIAKFIPLWYNNCEAADFFRLYIAKTSVRRAFQFYFIVDGNFVSIPSDFVVYHNIFLMEK